VTIPFDELGDGVFRRRYASFDLNIGVVIGGDGVLVIDTRASHRQAGELLGELRRLTRVPVRWVVNTHWHWDHTFGNAVFAGVELWGHRRCREVLRDHGEESKRAALEWVGEEHRAAIEEVKIRAPDRIIEQDGMIDIGGRSVRLEWLGLGHTDSDVVVSIVDAAVLFSGDLLEQGAPPQFGDGYPLAWQDTAAALRSRARGTTVPGHGDVMDKDAVAAACADGLATNEFDPTQGPYPEATMRIAWERAQWEVGVAPG
jgi:glyoxylase-like metal-dependent hydrolase (beta-lactamase superfamily II)